ncbi:MAG: RNA polymerase sporulation sigma factor SigK [Clostridia bacterium]|nr:RNA polymerase sporulation sigma factor SigK [Clostridia bacterium]
MTTVFSIVLTPIARLMHLILGISTPQQSFPPPLNQKEEEEKFNIARADADSEAGQRAREELILHNLRLVSHIVRKYYSTAKNQEDLVSIGTVGLVKAVDTFDVKNGARFATYAAKCIQNEILMHFRSRKKLSAEVSINETIDVDRDGNPLTYMDVISSDECVSEEIFRKVEAERALYFVRTRLDARERQVIILRFGLNKTPPMTQREISTRLGISRSYVSRIEKSAIDKLRHAFGE